MTLLLSLLLFLAGCQKPPPEPPPVVRPVKILTLGEGGASSIREYPATIRAVQQADLGFEVPGQIIEFLVNEGDLVEQGQLLARLDDRDYQADLEKAKANQRKAMADLQRSLNIYRQDKGAISKGQIEADRRAKEVADAALKQKEKAVEDTRLRAPFAGYVARKLVEDFANVEAKQPVLILQDISQLEVEVSIPERDVAVDTRGQTVAERVEQARPEVIVTSIPGRTFPARLKEFTTTADPNTRTFQVRLVFDKPDDVYILPGMTARVRVQVNRLDEMLIPVAAVASDDRYQAFVWRVDPETMTVHKVPVDLGELSGGNVAIKGGLKAGDRIAISGLRFLHEGMKIKPYQGIHGDGEGS